MLVEKFACVWQYWFKSMPGYAKTIQVGLKHKDVGGSFMISRESGAESLTSQRQKPN